MSWIIPFALAYFVIGLLSAWLCTYIDIDFDTTERIIVVFIFWPFVLAFILIMAIVFLPIMVIKYIVLNYVKFLRGDSK